MNAASSASATVGCSSSAPFGAARASAARAGAAPSPITSEPSGRNTPTRDPADSSCIPRAKQYAAMPTVGTSNTRSATPTMPEFWNASSSEFAQTCTPWPCLWWFGSPTLT